MCVPPMEINGELQCGNKCHVKCVRCVYGFLQTRNRIMVRNGKKGELRCLCAFYQLSRRLCAVGMEGVGVEVDHWGIKYYVSRITDRHFLIKPFTNLETLIDCCAIR